MTIIELLIPSIFALAGGLVAGFFARKLQHSQSFSLDSVQLLAWTKEFKESQAKAELTLEKANARIDVLEVQIKDAVDCSETLQQELNIVKKEKSTLQERVTVLEEENAQLKKQLDELKKPRTRKKSV